MNTHTRTNIFIDPWQEEHMWTREERVCPYVLGYKKLISKTSERQLGWGILQCKNVTGWNPLCNQFW